MPAEQAIPGQAAREAYWAALGYPQPPVEPHPDERRAWDDAAAVIAAPLSAEVASLREQADRLRIGDADLRRRLDDLASLWEHAAPDYQGECARELREALEGGQ